MRLRSIGETKIRKDNSTEKAVGKIVYVRIGLG